MALSTSAYKMEKTNDGKVRFIVESAQLSNFFGARFLIGVIGFFIGCTTGTLIGAGIFYFLSSFLDDIPTVILYAFTGNIYVLGALGFYKGFSLSKSWVIKMDQKQRGSGGEFIASEKGLEMPGADLISADRIHRLTLRNKVSNQEIPYAPSIVMGGSGMAGAGLGVGSLAGNAMSAALVTAVNASNRKRAEVSYCVNLEHSGVITELAGGLTETTAFGLMTDVGRILQMS